jgi:DNA uptake protein ComE-like DNA-binding protein
MTWHALKSYFKFTTSQRSGIFVMLSLIVLFQLVIYFVDFSTVFPSSPEKQQWLSLQSQIDSLKLNNREDTPKIYPFNPNFITDFKGYKLGMSTAEIDRLLAFRKTNKYVNSAQEFQAVTHVSDSLLRVISPYFKFPDWVTNKKANTYKNFAKTDFNKKPALVVLDINQASQEDLMKINGIGPALSERILNEKNKFGSFVSMEQMKDIWGLSPEVIEKLNHSFKIASLPNVKKIKINDASIKELMQLPYFKYALAKEIVTYRSMNGKINDSADLIKIYGFPVDKVKIIALYLEF